MGIIHLLSSDTINRIAAGEVIERPASIVKELVENSLDSGATGITIDIQNGGISFIRITDNGCGFQKEDIPVAFLRHATSKIDDENDLLHISSLGFRGEALSSIASVAKVELLTRKETDFLGSRYVINGGEEIAFEEAGCPQGTTFLIRDLFYNVPARRKFLKSATTEAGYINELVNRMAIANSNVSFSLMIQGRTVLHTSGNGNQKDTVYSVFGREIAENLIPVSYTGELVSIHGFLGKSVINRGNRNYEMFFVNGRYVRSALLYKAIEDAYSGFLMQHKYPFTALLFEVNPENLDVNIHPTKMDVRFSRQEELSEEVRNALHSILHQSVLIPDIALNPENTKVIPEKQPELFETKRILEKEKNIDASVPFGISEKKAVVPPADTASQSFSVHRVEYTEPISNLLSKVSEESLFSKEQKQPGSASIVATPKSEQVSLFEENAAKTSETASVEKTSETSAEIASDRDAVNVSEDFQQLKRIPDFHILGQVFQTYWIVEHDNEMYIIDQHAAHEKIIYERLVASMKNDEICSQAIMPSIIVSLSIREEELLLRYMDSFTKAGFEIDSFGGRDYQISAVPATLYRMDARDYFMGILDTLGESNAVFAPEQVYETIASMSCKAAIKGNSRVSEAEAKHLIEELLKLENPFHCPHGRPIIVSMTKYELEKKFKRIV